MNLTVGNWIEIVGTPVSSTTTNKAGLNVLLVSQDVINNTSLVRVIPWIMKTGGSGSWNYDTSTMKLNVGDKNTTTQIKYDLQGQTNNNKLYLKNSYPFYKYSGTDGYLSESGTYTYDFTIKHDDEGKALKIPIYAFIPLDNGSSSARNHVVDTTLNLPTIPRKSSCVWNLSYIGDPMYITITKATTSYTSSLKIVWETESSSTVGEVIKTKTSNTSITYNITSDVLKNLLKSNPTSHQVTATLTLDTYSSDTLIGTNEYKFTVPIKQINPDVSVAVVDTNQATIALTGSSSKIVRYISKPKVTITATPKQEATIKTYNCTWDNNISNTKETTLSNISTKTFTVSATDTRDFSTSKSITLSNFIEYIKINYTKFDLGRPESTSNTINLNIAGVWFNQSFGSKSNALSLKYRYKESGGTFSSYVSLSPTKTNNNFSLSTTLGTSFSFEKAYQFEFVINDSLMSITTVVDISKGTPIIRISETKVKIGGEISATKFNGYTLNSACSKGIKTLSSKGHSGWAGQTDGDSYLITKSFMAYWNGRFNDGGSNLTYCHQGEIQAKPKTLYDNSSGTTGTVTLSDSASNYKYLEIHYCDVNKTVYNSCKIYSPNGKNALLTISWVYNTETGGTQTMTKHIKISSKEISNVSYSNFNVEPSGVWAGIWNTIAIVQVVGYK